MEAQDNPLARQFLKFIEHETKEEAIKISQKYQKIMSEEFEEARAKIVAQAGVRLSGLMSIQDLGQTIRIEITKEKGI